MKIPKRILERVAAPIIASAALACSTSSPTPPPEPAPIAPTVVVEAAPEPVAYDAVAEAERLTRTDEVLASAETERDARIEDEEAAEARRQRRGTLGILTGGTVGIGVGTIGPPDDHWMAACGRG